MSAVVEREKWESVIIIMSKFCFGFVVVMEVSDVVMEVVSGMAGVVVSAVAHMEGVERRCLCPAGAQQ